MIGLEDELLTIVKPAPSDSKWNGGGLVLVAAGAAVAEPAEPVADADATGAGKPEAGKPESVWSEWPPA
jgi:hypothetical protein